MSKNILLCYYSQNGVTSYYHDFAEEFLKSGNKILHWNIYHANYVGKNKNKIFEKIINFKPDLIFSYNNICPEDVVREMKVPVLILDADNPEFFQNKEMINKYDFVRYLGYQSNSGELYKKILNVEINDKNYLFFPTATNFHRDPLKSRNINISFIGSNFYRNFLEGRILTSQERDTMLYLVKKIRENYYFTDPDIDMTLINFTKYYLAGQDRLKYLSALSDLGLEIYSNSDWKELFSHDLELANCYNNKTILTKKENQDIYNSSAIAINLSHLQATNSFSWRVPDIMASNACLVMESKVDWDMIFGGCISSYVKNAIIYSDQYDLRDKCKRLLRDEDLRLRCVEELQNTIEKNGRWKSRIESLESFLNLKLIGDVCNSGFADDVEVNKNSTEERLTQLQSQKMEKSEDLQWSHDEDKSLSEEDKNVLDHCYENGNCFEDDIFLATPKKKVKSRLAIILRCFVLIVYFIPFLGKNLIKKKKVNKIIYSISDKISQENY